MLDRHRILPRCAHQSTPSHTSQPRLSSAPPLLCTPPFFFPAGFKVIADALWRDLEAMLRALALGNDPLDALDHDGGDGGGDGADGVGRGVGGDAAGAAGPGGSEKGVDKGETSDSAAVSAGSAVNRSSVPVPAAAAAAAARVSASTSDVSSDGRDGGVPAPVSSASGLPARLEVSFTGHSMGGGVGVILAARCQRHFRRLNGRLGSQRREWAQQVCVFVCLYVCVCVCVCVYDCP